MKNQEQKGLHILVAQEAKRQWINVLSILSECYFQPRILFSVIFSPFGLL